jgi:large subunit ribosomal protein L24
MAGVRIRKDDTVQVLAGREKGKRGKIREVRTDDGKVIVADINIVKRHYKPGRTQARQAGIVELEAPLDASNVGVVCTRCDRPVRTAFRTLDNGSKSRICKRCGEPI